MALTMSAAANPIKNIGYFAGKVDTRIFLLHHVFDSKTKRVISGISHDTQHLLVAIIDQENIW